MAELNPAPQSRRNGPPYNPALRKLIDGKRKWHRPERTLPLPPKCSPATPLGTPPSGGSGGDGKTYQLQAWTVMPNHVHLVVDVWATPLSKLLNLWKGRSARAANLLLRRTGRFWEREYFDTLIRDGEHLKQAVRYTESNPVKATLVAERRAWRWGSARWRDEYERLPWLRGSPAA